MAGIAGGIKRCEKCGRASRRLIDGICNSCFEEGNERCAKCDANVSHLVDGLCNNCIETESTTTLDNKGKSLDKLPDDTGSKVTSLKKKVRWKVVLLSFLLPILGLFIALFVTEQVYDQEEKHAFEKKITDIRSAGVKIAAAKEKQRLAEEHAKKLAKKEAIEKDRKEAFAKVEKERKKKVVQAKVAMQAGQQKLTMEQARKKFNAYKEKNHILQSVYFAVNATHLGSASRAILDSVAKNYRFQLNQGKQVKFWLEGNTDNIGSRERNLGKGAEQADLVKQYLIKHGVKPNDIDSVSFGEERPMCTGSGEACRAFNRRVDIIKREG